MEVEIELRGFYKVVDYFGIILMVDKMNVYNMFDDFYYVKLEFFS